MSLAKTYGYIKYFHPSDEAANLDWNSFAILASKRVSVSENLEETLKELFLPIAPSIQFQRDGFTLDTRALLNKDIDSLQDIYWLHLGNGKGKIGNNYKSMRTYRKAYVLPQSNDDYGGIKRSLDVTKLRGKEIKIISTAKPNSEYMGNPLLRVSIKSKNGKWKSYDSSDEKLIKNTWNPLSVSTSIPENAEKVNLHLACLTMNGAVDIDYIKLQVKEDEKWVDFRLENSEFDNTDSFDKDWRPWGDNHEFKLVDKNGTQFLKVSRNSGVLKDVPFLFKTDSLKKRFLKKNIGSDLKLIFPIVLKGNKTTTFPIPNQENLRQLLIDIESTSLKINIEDEHTRLANIIKTWSTFQHFFPYFDLATVDWEEQFYKAIEKNESDKTYEDHLSTLKLMVSPLRDSHIGVYSFSLDLFYPPISWELIEEKLVVTNVLDTTLVIKPGDIITKVNGKPWKNHWNESYKRVSGATGTRRNYRNIKESLTGSENSNFSIEVSSSTQEIHLKRNLIEGLYDRMLSKKVMTFKEIEPDIFYVNLSRMPWQQLKEKLPEIIKAKGVVFDLRGYPRGGMMNLLSHITRDSIQLHQSFTPKMIYPDELGSSFLKLDQQFIAPVEPYINVKKVFLTNGVALSYSESFLIPIEYYGLADIVGEPTGGSTGNTNNIYLFGDIVIPWTGRKVLRQDESVFHGRGVLPNHPVNKTIRGTKEEKDEYLEYALKLIKG